jgi:hypothetical protein
MAREEQCNKYFYESTWIFYVFFIDHETAIMHRLQSIVLEHTELLLKVMEYTAELDW